MKSLWTHSHAVWIGRPWWSDVITFWRAIYVFITIIVLLYCCTDSFGPFCSGKGFINKVDLRLDVFFPLFLFCFFWNGILFSVLFLFFLLDYFCYVTFIRFLSLYVVFFFCCCLCTLIFCRFCFVFLIFFFFFFVFRFSFFYFFMFCCVFYNLKSFLFALFSCWTIHPDAFFSKSEEKKATVTWGCLCKYHISFSITWNQCGQTFTPEKRT